MSDYRLYCLDGDGHIHLAEWVEAGDDDEAVTKARVMTPDANLCEVWRDTRMIAKISPSGLWKRLVAASGKDCTL